MTSVSTPDPPSPAQLSIPAQTHSLQHRAARGFSTLALRYGLVIAVNFAGTIALSRLLGPSLWGIFAITQLIYLSSQEVLGRGLATYLIKQDAPPSQADIGSVFLLQHALGLTVLFAIAWLAHPVARWYGHPELYPLLLAAAIASYAYAWRSIPLMLLERDFEYVAVAIIEVLETVLFYIVAVAMTWKGDAIRGLAVAILLRNWAPTVLSHVLKPVRLAVSFHRQTIRAIADFGLTVAVSSTVNIAMLLVPALFVGKITGMEALGQAQMAFSLYSNLLFVTAAVLRLGFSTYARLVERPQELARNVNHHLEVLSIMLVPAIVLFAGLSPFWISLALGPKWKGLAILLLAQAPGYLFVSVFWGILNPALLVSGKHRAMLLWLVSFTLVYALLAWSMTLRWGALGVALAFSTAEVLFHPWLFWMYSRLYGPLNYKGIFVEIMAGMFFLLLIWNLCRYSPPAALFAAISYLLFWHIRNGKELRDYRSLAGSWRWRDS